MGVLTEDYSISFPQQGANNYIINDNSSHCTDTELSNMNVKHLTLWTHAFDSISAVFMVFINETMMMANIPFKIRTTAGSISLVRPTLHLTGVACFHLTSVICEM